MDFSADFLVVKRNGEIHLLAKNNSAKMDEDSNSPQITENSFRRVQQIIEILQSTSEEDRKHIWNTVGTWFKLVVPSTQPHATSPAAGGRTVHAPAHSIAADTISFSDREEMSPKEFLNEKMPTTDVERIACLAYYLTHYRGTPDFKTADMTKLNTEAAQRKLSNPTVASKNAIQGNYLTMSSKKGHRQLSAMGEQYVNALPDRDEANSIRRKMSPRKSKVRKTAKKIAT